MADELQKQLRKTGWWAGVAVIIAVGIGATLLGRAMFRKEAPSTQELKLQEAADFARQQVWASDAKSAMLFVRGLMTRHKRKFGDWPQSIADLPRSDIESGLSKARPNWDIEVTSSPYPMVIATSTAEMPGGEGHQITYDLSVSEWQGYSIAPPPHAERR